RGYLWLSCEDNEARGELVEQLCGWHRRRRSVASCDGGSSSADSAPGATSSPAAAKGASATLPAPESALAAASTSTEPRSESGTPGVDGGGDVGGGGGGGNAMSGGGAKEEEEEEDEEEEMLEVDQVLLSELVGDLGSERSLNVTALLLADADALG
ncbi:unnamed protein product, partial [Hapterophycus canaliculatus]